MKNPFNGYQDSRFIIADENFPHYPIRGLTDLLSLRELCREKTDSLRSEIETINAGDCADSAEKFNRQNKLSSKSAQLEKFEKVLKLIELDVENILSGTIKMV